MSNTHYVTYHSLSKMCGCEVEYLGGLVITESFSEIWSSFEVIVINM